jgi:hypothetical protein
VVTDLGQGNGIQNTGFGSTSLTAANGSIQVLGSRVSAAGGNVVLSAAGTSDTHSLEIVDNGGTRSTVSTTGTGTINLNGSLTGGGASATGGSAAGVVVTNSSITAGTGAINITGSVGGASTGGQVERGFRVDTGSVISGAGNVTLTGAVAGNQPILPDPYMGPASMGGELANGATVSSTGGNVTLSGTFNNGFHYDGTGLRVDGKVQSGAGSKVTLTGSSTQGAYPTGGLFSGSGTGLFTGLLSEIVAGTGGLDVTGTVDSTFPSTNLTGASLNGAATSAGNIAVTGTSLAFTASGVRALYLGDGTLAATGAATITLTGSGVFGNGTASSYDLNINGTAVSTAGGQINLTGNRMNIASTVNSGSGVTAIKAFTNSPADHPWRCNGTNMNKLNLTNAELNNITASVLRDGQRRFHRRHRCRRRRHRHQHGQAHRP